MAGPWEKYAQQAPSDDAPGPWTKYQMKPEPSDDVDPEAMVQGAGSFASAGYLPELTGAVGRMLPDPNADVDAKLKAQGFDIQQPQFQGMTTDQSRAMQKQMASESPGSYYGGAAIGGIASAPAFGAALKGLGIARAAVPVAEGAAPIVESLGSRVLQAGKEGAALGALSNPNSNEGDSGLNLGGRAVGGLAGGAIGSAIPAIGAAIKGSAGLASDGASYLGNKLLSSLGGVKPEVIREYAQYADRINSAPTPEALKNISDEFVGKLAEDVDAKKLSADKAQEVFSGFQSDLKDQYKTAGYDARDAATSAQQTLKDAHNSRLQQVSGDIYDTINKLKSDVQSGSGKALDVLEKSDKFITLKPIFQEINAQIDQANQAGTKEAKSLAQELADYRDGLAEAADYRGRINPVDAKRKIQGLDQITQYNPLAGSFDKTKNAAYKDIRSAFDKSVKATVPAYKAAMEPVAADSDLLNRVSDFGDKQSAASLLGRLDSPTQFERKAALQELGNKYGVDFINAVNPESLPEYQLVNKTASAKDALRPDRVASKVDETVANSRYKTEADAAQKELVDAQEKLAPFKPLAPNAAGQTQAQQKLAQLAKGGNIETEEMFKKLGELTNTDFARAMKDRNILAAFEKGATNGSRNTLIGSVLGYGVGGMMGAGAGASAGRIVDQWGPAITKKILDGAIKVSRSPTVATISSLDIPESVKRNMIIGLEAHLSRGASESVGPSAARSVAGKNQGSPDQRAIGRANGGVIPGKAQVAGDSRKNDTVHIMASPGEGFIPRSHMTSRAKAHEFVDQMFSGKHGGSKSHFSDGGTVPSGETLGSIIGYPGFPKPKPKAMAHGGVVPKVDPSIAKYAKQKGISYDAAKQYLMKGKKR